jgi:hypothetical protein
MDTIKRKTGTSFDAGKEVGLKVNTEKTKYTYVAVSSPECREKSVT